MELAGSFLVLSFMKAFETSLTQFSVLEKSSDLKAVGFGGIYQATVYIRQSQLSISNNTP